jgi:hypothetical protein
MRTYLLAFATLATVLTGPARSADNAPPPSVLHSATASPPQPIDELPWNPDIHQGNVWPYDKPLVIDTDYCGPPGEFWVRGEYLQWWLKGDHVPPLATAGPTGSAGLPGQPGVTTVLGGNTTDTGPYYGGRFTAGVWFESAYVFGFEGSYFFLADRSVKYLAVSTGQPGSPDLGRPFQNVVTGQPGVFGVASASLVVGPTSGSVRGLDETELQGADGLLVWNLCRQAKYSVDLLAGFRYVDLGGVLTVATATTPLIQPVGTGTFTTDQFAARNHFYGGEAGARADYRWHHMVFTLVEKLALGARTTDIVIAGGTTVVPTVGRPTTIPGAVLAQPSNSGLNHSDDVFAVVNELGLQAGWQFTDCVQAFLGYSFFYFNSVVRAGDVPDFGVNPFQPLGPARPAFAPRTSDFWAHGFNVGLEIRY